MSRSKIPLKPLHELTSDDQFVDCFALLAEKTRGVAQNGKPYYSCRFRNAHRSVTAMIWGDTALFDQCESEWHRGQFYKIRGRYSEHERYGPQFEVSLLRPVQEGDAEEGFDPTLLVEASRYSTEEMLEELKEIARKHIQDEPLRRLTLDLLEAQAEPLKKLPATQTRFYTFVGGLLEHTLSVTKNCLLLFDRYAAHYQELIPPLNKNLVVAGAILHDIGRTVEMSDDVLAPEPTVPGRLIGHLILGRDLIRDAARKQDDLHPELLQMLEHMVLTHLALPEWGSPRLPLIPEVILLHHADDLDAKMQMYAYCLSRDCAEGPFTDRDSGLNRRLYKGREV